MVEVEGGGEGLYELDGLLVEEGKGEGGRGDGSTSSSTSKRVKPPYLGSVVEVEDGRGGGLEGWWSGIEMSGGGEVVDMMGCLV